MVYKHSVISVVDNTGIKKVKVIQVYNQKRGRPGFTLLTTVNKKKKVKKYVKKKVNYSFLISAKTIIFRTKGAYFLRLFKNQAVVLGADNEKLLGTRHKGFLTLESKKNAFVQLLRTCRLAV
jgi:ribosomal protein L14